MHAFTLVEGTMLQKVDRVNLRKVRNLDEYMQPCTMHEPGCTNHECVSVHGAILPPSSLVVIEPVPNTLGAAIINLFISGDVEVYSTALRAILNGKDGLFREGCMGGKVMGSIRSVIVPAVGVGRGVLYLPRQMYGAIRYPGHTLSCIRNHRFLAGFVRHWR